MNNHPFPYIKHELTFRLVELEDAEFILQLRSNEKKSKHLSQTNPTLDAQKSWILDYKTREEKQIEFYILVANSTNSEKLGLYRIYNVTESSFEAGSWLFKPGVEMFVPIVADIEARFFAFEFFKINTCKFNVSSENKSVLRYHLNFNPRKIGEDHENIFFELDKLSFLKYKQKLFKFLGYDNN